MKNLKILPLLLLLLCFMACKKEKDNNDTEKNNKVISITLAPPYDPKTNFSGGKLGISTANSDIVEEFTSGAVGVEKSGDRYKISVNVVTAKGAVFCEYDGVLIKQGS